MSNKVQVCFMIGDTELKRLKEHASACPESENALIVRLLTGYFNEHGCKEPPSLAEEPVETSQKVCMVDKMLRQELRAHRFFTGESSSALLRRLLVAYFAEHI